MKKYKIHFVCRGNVYRSRLAEAYVKSIEGGNSRLTASSSGIAASAENPGVELCSYALSAARAAGVENALSKNKAQTTDEQLKDADVVVFMDQDVYQDAKQRYTVNPHNKVVWDIKDMAENLAARHHTINDTEAVTDIARNTLGLIKRKIDTLVAEITAVSWADIVDENNQPLHFRLPISWANTQGLWQRSCHVVILTADNKFVVEKRSNKIIFSPGHLDITLGGSVDDGERPEGAATREIREELGLHINPQDLEPIEVRKWNSYHPHYAKYTKCFLYTYRVKLSSVHPIINIQRDEVADVRVLSYLQMKKLLRTHRLLRFGQLSSGFRYYEKIIRLCRP